MEKIINVLIASNPDSSGTVVQALSGHSNVIFTSTLNDAMTRSLENIDLIICNIYFDESRMFDFLRYAKINNKARAIPFLCINSTESGLSATLKQSVEIACTALGAAGFIDLFEWRKKYGASETEQKFRDFVLQITQITSA